MQKCGRNSLGREDGQCEGPEAGTCLAENSKHSQLGQTDPWGEQQKMRCQRQWRQPLQDILNHSEAPRALFLRTEEPLQSFEQESDLM